MTYPTKRNIQGLRQSAQQKSNDTHRRAEEAIALLVRERRTINFNTVAETADCSTAWLYANVDIKQRIIHLRAQQIPRTQIKVPKAEQASTTSKDAVIAALQKRVREQAGEIKELKRQLEVAYGQLSKR
jgi:predicted RNase H-like nuclease (RuvC/YqgF family)